MTTSTLEYDTTRTQKQMAQENNHPARPQYIDNNKPAQPLAPNKLAKMPKEKAQSLVSKLKRTTLVTSIVAFVLFGGLIAPQIQAVAAKSSTTSTTTSTTTQTPASSSSSFFGQSQGSYSIGSSSTSASSGSTSSGSTSTNTSNNTTAGTSTHVS